MRVLVLTHNYPRFSGDPAGAFVHRIASAAARDGHQVAVEAPHAPGLAETESVEGVALHRFRYGPDVIEKIAYTGDLHTRATRSPFYALGVPMLVGAFYRAARRTATDFRPDIVHAHWWIPAGWIAARLSRPFLVTCHGSDVRLLERSRAFRAIARPVFERAAAVTTVSTFLAADLTRLLGLKPGRVLPLAMPVDLGRFAAGTATPKAEPPRILYAGNLVPSKGVDVLIAAFALLRQRGVSCQLKVLGEGSAEPALRADAARRGLDDIVWSRFVPQDRMPTEYGASAATVLPSRGNAEGLGLGLVEALAAGSAVVGTPAGGIPEVIRPEETGLLVPDGDAEALAAALQRLLADRSLRERLIRQGQQFVTERFSTESAVRPFLALYDDIARRRSN
jgi:glycosyltransferase involved in cell wall biosynthesis